MKFKLDFESKPKSFRSYAAGQLLCRKFIGNINDINTIVYTFNGQGFTIENNFWSAKNYKYRFIIYYTQQNAQRIT